MISDKETVCPNNLLDVAHTKKGVTAGIVNAGKPLPMLSVMDAVKEELIIPTFIGDKKEIQKLGYECQHEENDWHKPAEGEYKVDDEGNLIIIHSCPYREIFGVEIIEYLEDLFINQQWVINAEHTVM